MTPDVNIESARLMLLESLNTILQKYPLWTESGQMLGNLYEDSWTTNPASTQPERLDSKTALKMLRALWCVPDWSEKVLL